jgi:mono/diheme cytochrome c family protein
MKRNGIRYVVLLIVLIAIVAAGMYVLSRRFSAKDEPSAIEVFIARRLRLLAIPRHARELPNPIKGNPDVLARATEHFADHCASCHGNDGKGGTLIGRGLYPKPPDMTHATTQQLTDGELYYIIENGVRFTGMPGFAEQTGNEKILRVGILSTSSGICQP